MTERDPFSDIHLFRRTESELTALRHLSALWEQDGSFWSYDDILAAIARPGSFVLFCADEVESPLWKGVAMVDVGPGTADLLYIFVRREHRGKGIAARLLERVIAELPSRSVKDFFLEVRESNAKAQRLYESFSMRRIGRRRSYYSDGEDAYVYKLSLTGGEGS